MSKREGKFWVVLFVSIMLAVYGWPAQAAEFNVPGDYPTIQDAIDAASDGDTVLVDDGTYIENIIFLSKSVTLKSVNSAESTIIDGGGYGKVVSFYNNGASGHSVLDGFTIRNGSAYNGAGIYCYNAAPAITNCIIKNNTAGNDGGGIYCAGSASPTVANCRISNNIANHNGGGIYGEASSLTIENCAVNSNTALSWGGGICSYDSSSVMINNCTIKGNTASDWGGGGIYGEASSQTIENCIISSNMAGYEGGGISSRNSLSYSVNNCKIRNNSASRYGGGIYLNNSSSTISGCIITNNQAGYDGGGICCYRGSSPEIVNCAVFNNTAQDDGGGISCSRDSMPTITNCTIIMNTAYDDGGGIACFLSSSPVVVNSILWGDRDGDDFNEIYLSISSSMDITFSDVQGGWAGEGNIDMDPLFESNDYHLSVGSPCIDVCDPEGAPPNDIDGDIRPQGDGYDMGCDEYKISVSEEPSLSISINKQIVGIGETVYASLETTVGAEDRTVDLYVRVILPDGETYYYNPWGKTYNPRERTPYKWIAVQTPLLSSRTVIDWGPSRICSHNFRGDETSGEYTLEACFTEPGTFNVIGEISRASFIFEPSLPSVTTLYRRR